MFPGQRGIQRHTVPQKTKNHGALYKCMILVDRLTEGPGWYNWQLECGDGPSGLKDLFLFVLFQGPLGIKIRKKRKLEKIKIGIHTL